MIHPYRPYKELLSADEATLSADEMMRLHRIKEIPDAVRKIVIRRIEEITDAVTTLSKEADILHDYLNGEGFQDGI